MTDQKKKRDAARRATRIVATIGPASSDPAMLEALVDAGVDLFRLNFSHGSHDEHRARYDVIRRLERRKGRRIAVLQDLQGPKFRIGECRPDVTLKAGSRFTLDRSGEPADSRRAGLPHPELFDALLPGQRILLDDGRLELKVTGIGADGIATEVLVGGPLSARKGVNVPDTDLQVPAMTDKDRHDLALGLELGVDWVALSFVQRPGDLLDAIAAVEGRAAICAKIEKPGALRHLREIVTLADSVMVARGDLGVELPAEDVPNHQRDILAECRRAGKPAIVATQMLDSMVSRPVPTRAEASDVSAAVLG
ncbi:pyruvate kinase, partial [Marinibaculum pumilum]